MSVSKVKQLFGVSFLIGTFTGLAVSFYVFLSKLVAYTFYLGNPFETIPRLPFWYVAFVTTASILLVNLIILHNDRAKEYGVREIAQALEENKITFTLGDLALKTVASAISIGSGFAVGNEGPSAAIGAMIAYRLHSFFRLPRELLKVAIGVGASSGISAVFVSPVTGIVFAVENVAYFLIKDFVGFMVVGSFCAFVVAVQFLAPLLFHYSLGKQLSLDYLFSLLLFVPFITLTIYLYLLLRDKLLYFLSSLAQEKLSPYLKVAVVSLVAGTTLAALLKISPYAGFSGHEVVEALINSRVHFPLITLFLLALLRIVANGVSLYANAVGGLFITLMSIGALSGYAFAELLGALGLPVEPFYFAAVGSAVMVGVVMKIPFTAVVLALETTYDYNVVVPTGLVVALVGALTSLAFELKKAYLKRPFKSK